MQNVTEHHQTNPTSLYNQLYALGKHLAPTWRKTQVVNLAHLAHALFARRTLEITQLAWDLPDPEKPKTDKPKHTLLQRVKRLWRFLSNDRVDEAALMARLARLSYSTCRWKGLILPILIDNTYFHPFTVFTAAVPRGGRAWPIAWRVFKRDLEGEENPSQNAIIEAAIKQMIANIALPVEAAIVADREFARASLFRSLKGIKARFAIRVDAQTWIISESYQGPLSKLGIKAGDKRRWLPGVLYAKEEQEPVNLLAVWEVGQDEPWFIASDLDDPELVERLYRSRMKIEQNFRDWKLHLRLKGTLRLTTAPRLSRLITAVAVLYWYACLLAVRLKASPMVSRVCCWGKLGDLELGLRLIELATTTIMETGIRIIRWLAEKLRFYHPLLPAKPPRPDLAPQSG
jgi:hypothetical protein